MFGGRYGYIIRRLILLVPTLILAATLIFLLMDIIPGDAAQVIMGPEASLREVEAMREMLGLNLPLYLRYFNWLSRMLRLDLGISLISRESINMLIADRLPVTLTYATFAMIVALMIGIFTGIVSAVKRDTPTDLFVSIIAFLGVSIPGFWLGLILILVFSVNLHWLPSAGWVSLLEDPIGGIAHMIMPATMLGAILAATISRQTRSALLEVMLQDYIVTARAKGLAEKIVIFKHALKNAMIPVITIVGIQFGGLLGGSVVAEIIFQLPGVGKLMYNAVWLRDYTLVQGICLVVTFIYVFVNLLVDVFYMYLDPRVRMQ
jgi:peptide/nickel transport system permease protein